MLDQVTMIAQALGVSTELLLIVGFALGAMIVFLGLAALTGQQNPAADRLASLSAASRYQQRLDRGLLRPASNNPGRFMKSFVPADESKRTELQNKLSQAGFNSTGALWTFTIVRTILGLALPGALLGVILLLKSPGIDVPFYGLRNVSKLSNMQVFQLLTILIALGYFGPLYWLQRRVAERQRRIEEGFPNALDLLQISVEAGLGFDAAMTRVGNELVEVSPDIAFEFLSVQTQVQAGRARDVALVDMATRTGVDTVRSFAHSVQQSMQFGTSMSESLKTYSKELRDYREMKAQEMANKLPVKMSAVLASLMLPALILLTVGPVLIRYIRFYGG